MSTEAILSMKHWVTAIILSVTAAAMLVSNGGGMMTANAISLSQTGALIGYGGQIFGLVDVSSDGHQTDVKVATNYLPPSGKDVRGLDGGRKLLRFRISLELRSNRFLWQLKVY